MLGRPTPGLRPLIFPCYVPAGLLVLTALPVGLGPGRGPGSGVWLRHPGV